MTHSRALLALVLFVTTLVVPAAAAAQCSPFGLGLYYLDSTVPVSVNVSFFPPAGSGSAVTMLEGFTPSSNPSCAGSNEALLRVTIPEGCSQANVWIEYEGTPIGWTLNVGDSDGNNGFGGDAGEPDSEAELQILDETLSVYSSAIGPGIVDLLTQEDMGLTDGALEIVVRDQYLSWGQPFSSLDTTNSGLLFALPDAGAETEDQNTFYIGVNRVVSGPGDRTGCGVRRVLVSFR